MIIKKTELLRRIYKWTSKKPQTDQDCHWQNDIINCEDKLRIAIMGRRTGKSTIIKAEKQISEDFISVGINDGWKITKESEVLKKELKQGMDIFIDDLDCLDQKIMTEFIARAMKANCNILITTTYDRNNWLTRMILKSSKWTKFNVSSKELLGFNEKELKKIFTNEEEYEDQILSIIKEI